MSDIQVYGADWCEDTVRTRQHLESLGLPYDYLNVDQDDAAKQWVMKQNDGKQKTPTVKVANKIVLSEPSDAELDIALRKNGLIK
ncbi:MAG TPA: glutaredoxin domain-containing protein [Tepidisphaeraceae bacterium]|jgi:mycoredoxin